MWYVHINATTQIWLLRAYYSKEMQRETEELRIESWWTKERATKSPIFKIDIACERDKSFLLRKKRQEKTEKDEIEQEMHLLLTLGLGFRFPVYTRYASQLPYQSSFRIGFQYSALISYLTLFDCELATQSKELLRHHYQPSRHLPNLKHITSCYVIQVYMTQIDRIV